MTYYVYVLSFKFLLLAMHCGKSWVTYSCPPAPSYSWIHMLALCHLANFSFPTLRALLRLPGRLLHLQGLFSYSAIFSMDIGCVKCGPWRLGVANSTEMSSVWFAALLPIMLNHCLSSWALCIIKLMFAKKYPSDTSLAVGLEATTILTSFLKAKWGKLKIQSRNQSHFPEFASTEFF